MLARKLPLILEGLEVGTTPMLVPSVSSRLNFPMRKLLETISEIIDGPLLISAYDISKIDDTLISFPDLIFLDSGGYECNKDQDVSDIGLYKPEPREWNKNSYSQVIDSWSNKIPTVLVSYDHPSQRESIEKQIDKANKLFHGKDTFFKEILIKPETKDSKRINLKKVISNIESISSFDMLAFTDKELGYSLLDRMVAVAKIRIAMDKEGIKIPLHIFGSLDTVTTPLYYLAGADIFDGLSWLRFVFDEGNTLYLDSYGPKLYGAEENFKKIWIRSVYQNYNYLRKLKLNLEKFQSKKNFNVLGPNGEFFKNTYEDLNEKIKGDFNGR